MGNKDCTFISVIGGTKGGSEVEVAEDPNCLAEVRDSRAGTLGREVHNFLADVMASLEAIDKATNDTLVVFLINWGWVSRGLKERVIRWGGGGTCDIVFLDETLDIALHVVGYSASGGVNFDVLAEVGCSRSIVGKGAIAVLKDSDKVLVELGGVVDHLAVIHMHRDDALASRVSGTEFDIDTGVGFRGDKAGFEKLGLEVFGKEGIGLLKAIKSLLDEDPFTREGVG